MYDANVWQSAAIHLCIMLWSLGCMTATQLTNIVTMFYHGAWG